MVQSSQVTGVGRRGWKTQGEAGSCLVAAVGCLGLAQHLSWLGPPATATPEPVPLYLHKVRSWCGNPDYLGQKAVRKKGAPHFKHLSKSSSLEVSTVLLCPVLCGNIHSFFERVDCRMENTDNLIMCLVWVCLMHFISWGCFFPIFKNIFSRNAYRHGAEKPSLMVAVLHNLRVARSHGF